MRCLKRLLREDGAKLTSEVGDGATSDRSNVDALVSACEFSEELFGVVISDVDVIDGDVVSLNSCSKDVTTSSACDSTGTTTISFVSSPTGSSRARTLAKSCCGAGEGVVVVVVVVVVEVVVASLIS